MENYPQIPAPGRLLARLPAAWRSVVDLAAALSRRLDVPVYLLGGPVRDLLLDRPARDLDLVVEGDGVGFAAHLAERVGGSVGRSHAPFLTAEVILPDGGSIDVASTRREVYPRPAALPRVRPAGLDDDLRRRDFTVNAMAIRLGPAPAPEWIDPLGGVEDLRARRLRILRRRSFVDDPTRLLRAVRLEARLGFRMEAETEELARRAVTDGAFEPLSASRLHQELTRTLGDPETAAAVLERLAELGWLSVLAPGLAAFEPDRTACLSRRLEAALVARSELVEHPSLAGDEMRPDRLALALLSEEGGSVAAADIADRLALTGRDREVVLGEARRAAAARSHGRGDDPPPPHAVAAALEPLAAEDLALLAAGESGAAVRRYLDRSAGLRLRITGEDLIAAGVQPGPALGAALARTRDARLDGEIGADDELAFALGQVSPEAGR